MKRELERVNQIRNPALAAADEQSKKFRWAELIQSKASN